MGSTTIAELRQKLEHAAFLVAQDGKAQEAHQEIIRALVLLSDLEAGLSSSVSDTSPDEVVAREVNKVARRLRLWASRPSQINSKILTAYLKLERSGTSPVTEDQLRAALPGEDSFYSNFAQMKAIADRNHGKVFEQSGTRVMLWEPVLPYVREYENKVFG